MGGQNVMKRDTGDSCEMNSVNILQFSLILGNSNKHLKFHEIVLHVSV
jgi:hypothetical protein